MKIACKYDSILSSCGFQVICSKRDSLRFYELAKNILFIDLFWRFSIRVVTPWTESLVWFLAIWHFIQGCFGNYLKILATCFGLKKTLRKIHTYYSHFDLIFNIQLVFGIGIMNCFMTIYIFVFVFAFNAEPRYI